MAKHKSGKLRCPATALIVLVIVLQDNLTPDLCVALCPSVKLCTDCCTDIVLQDNLTPDLCVALCPSVKVCTGFCTDIYVTG